MAAVSSFAWFVYLLFVYLLFVYLLFIVSLHVGYVPDVELIGHAQADMFSAHINKMSSSTECWELLFVLKQWTAYKPRQVRYALALMTTGRSARLL